MYLGFVVLVGKGENVVEGFISHGSEYDANF